MDPIQDLVQAYQTIHMGDSENSDMNCKTESFQPGHPDQLAEPHQLPSSMTFMFVNPWLSLNIEMSSKQQGCFLQDFDLDSDICLEEAQQIDDVKVLALMGANAKAQGDRAVGRIGAWQSTELELQNYPFGRTSTWI
jgi:hypothetical protein